MIDPDQPLTQHLQSLDVSHRSNLGFILGLDQEEPTAERLADSVRWLYHSRARSALVDGGASLVNRATALVGRPFDLTPAPPPVPTYRQLLSELAQKLDIELADLPLETVEKAVIYTVITECLTKMDAMQRIQFFEQSPDTSNVLGDGVTPSAIRGPLQTLSLLGMANAFGGSLYAAASTALGMVTHAAGLSLPASVFAGLSSTAAFVIGPAGWLVAGTWLAWRLTGPDWKVLTPLVMYLVTQRHEVESMKKPADSTASCERP